VLPVSSAENVHDLRDLLPLVLLIAACNCVLDAMGNVVAKNLLLCTAERRPNGGYLGHHVDAVAILIDHPRQASDLAFDPAEAFPNGGFRIFLHA
jgi:hypothetical protein